MVGVSTRMANLRMIGLVVLICHGTLVDAQPPPEPAPVLEATPDDDTLKPGSNSSFTLMRRQSMIQVAEIARDAVARGDYLSALPLLERILSEPNSFVPSGPSLEVTTHEEVHRLMRQLPAGMRQRLEEQRRAVSLRAWDQVRVGDVADVTEFVQQFGDLPLGVDAWWWLACNARDHARRQLAASAFWRMATHPHASTQQRAMALVAGAEVLSPQQSPIQTKPFIERIMGLDSKLEIRIGGRALTIGQWLDERLPDVSVVGNAQPTDPSRPIVHDRLRRPISEPIWKRPLVVPLAATLTAQEQKQRDQGVRPIPLLRPLMISDRVIMRTLDSIRAFSQLTGDEQWSIPNVEYRQLDRMRGFDSLANQTIATDWAQRRTQADSIFGRMSTDRRRLFAIQEPDRIRELRTEREFPRVMSRSGPQFNKLCAYSLETGELEWEIGGPETGASDRFGGCFFCGCPLVVDDILFVVTQHETQVQLQAIDPDTGSLKWSLALGSVLLPITEDLQRSRVACPIVWHDGLLYCSTSSGVIIAVDPLLRTMKWGYRYPATTFSAGDLLPAQNPYNVHLNHEPWWDLWREPFAAVASLIPPEARTSAEKADVGARAGSILVFASPESDHLHAVRLPDGELAWKVPRAGGLIVAGIVDGLVIVVEGDFVRAHDLGTGEQRWRTMTGEISGSSAIAGSVIVLPAQSGGTILLDVHTGQMLSDSSGVDTPLGSLTEFQAGWIACSRQSVMRLPKLDDVRRGVEKRLSQEPDNESLRVQAAFLDLQAGDSASARGRLDGLQSSPARELRRQALIEALREPDTDRSVAERSDLARQLKDLAEDVDYKFAAGVAIGTSSLAAADLVAAVDAALEGLTSDLDQPESLVKNSSVIARKDRVLLGLIEESYRRAKPGDLPAMDQLFMTRLKDARKSRDRLAVQRLATQWRGLDWSRQLVVLEDERVFRRRSPVEVELRLLDAAGSADTSIALQALDRLAQKLDQPATRQESRAVRRRILQEFPTAKFADGTTEAERITRNAKLRPVESHQPKDEFPPGEPDVKVLDDRTFGVSLVPMHAEPGSLAERMDLVIDRLGTEILFRGASFFQYGQDESHERKLELPPSTSPYRAGAYMLREGWGIGHIVILLVGTELFAISPLDARGDPDPRFLWSNPIELQSSPHGERMVTSRAGTDESRQVLVDQTNRPIGRIGPVRAGYLCYQKGTKLIAVETDTGRQLWERLDFPKDATVLGDDKHIFVWNESEVVEVLSAIDGRKIEERVWRQSPSTMVHNRGSLVWTVSRHEETRTELHDLVTGESIWFRTDPAKSQVAALDAETLAVARPEGQLQILTARTGAPVCAPFEVDCENLKSLVTWKDSYRWYIAVSRSGGNMSKLRAHQPNDSYRLRFLSGSLYAVDRDEPRILWDRKLQEEPIPLDQSVVAPVIVQLWRLAPANDRSPVLGILRITDKKTGKMLVDPNRRREDLQPYFLLNPDPQQGIVEVKLARQTIRLTYASDQPADAAEAIGISRENHPPN